MLARFDDLSFVDTAAVGDKLRAAALPVFAISAAGNRVMPPGLAVFVDEVGRQEYFGPAVKNIERMVSRQTVEAVVGGLVNLPAVKLDLQRLLALGHQSNPALLNLFAEEMPPVKATFALPKQARLRGSADAASEAASEAASSAAEPASAASAPASAATSAQAPASASIPASASSAP